MVSTANARHTPVWRLDVVETIGGHGKRRSLVRNGQLGVRIAGPMDTTTAYFGIDEPDETEQEFADRRYAPQRRRGHSKEGRDNQPQVIIALAVTRDGMPVRSWVLPGDTADVTTVARIKDDLWAWRLGRCLFVGDAEMYSADNLAARGRGLGRYILAVPMSKLMDVERDVLTRPGRYKQVADNLRVKEVWAGDGERRKRYVLCLNPHEAECERQHRVQLLRELDAELTLLEQRKDNDPKVASRRFGRYLSADGRGRPQLDPAKIKAAEKFDGKFVVISNDDTLSAEDIALGYKGGWIIEACFRRMKQTGLEVRPTFHWTPAPDRGARQTLCVGLADAAGRRDPLPASLGADRPFTRQSEGGALPMRGPAARWSHRLCDQRRGPGVHARTCRGRNARPATGHAEAAAICRRESLDAPS